MTEQSIAIYCFIDDSFLAIGRKDDAHCKLSDAELLATALLAARYFHENIRIPRCRLLRDERYRGRSAGKRRYFYGFKVQLVTTEDGLPVQFYIHAASFADVTAFKAMPVDLPRGSELYTDSGYTCHELEGLFRECGRLGLKVCRKTNSRRVDEPHTAFLKNHYCKRIEAAFSGITNFFLRKIHAITAEGFVLKLILFIFAYTLNQLIA